MRKLLLSLLALFVFSAEAAIVEVDRIVAIVNDDVVMLSELNNQIHTIRAQLAQRGQAAPPDESLRKQVLERIIITRLQLQVAERSGITVSDNQINRAIANIASQNGMTITQFRATLEADGFDFETFREDMRRNMITSRVLQRNVKQRINITEREIDNFLATNKTQRGVNEQYHLQHILIGVPDGASSEQIKQAEDKALRIIAELRNGADFTRMAQTRSDGQNALNGGDLGWRSKAELPSLFIEAVQNMQQGEISNPIRSPSGFHIIKLSELRSEESRHVVQQTHARHILIRPSELTSAEDARVRLEQLKIRLENGEDFASLARAHSDDRGSAANGGDLGWTGPGDLVGPFEAAMNELQPGQISEPFQTPFGWHIVQVVERRNYDDTEKYLRNAARTAILKRKEEEETEAFLRRLRDEAYVEYRLDDVY
jgi:peptidyl-prolyl cis-trans isomerase SurA